MRIKWIKMKLLNVTEHNGNDNIRTMIYVKTMEQTNHQIMGGMGDYETNNRKKLPTQCNTKQYNDTLKQNMHVVTVLLLLAPTQLD